MKTTVSLHNSEKHTFSASFKSWLNRGNGLFSLIMDDFITNRQALLLSNALLAFAALICCIGSHPFFVFLMAGWLLLAVILCEKGGLK